MMSEKETMDYLRLAHEIVKQVSRKGVEAEALIMAGQTTMVRVNKGKVEQLAQATPKGLGVRVIKGGRMGYAYTSDLSPQGVEETWRDALALAGSADPDEYRSLPQPQPIEEEDLALHDPALVTIPTEEKIALTKEVEEAALSFDPRIVATIRCVYQDEAWHIYLANSRGLADSYERTVAASYLRAVARDEESQVAGWGVGLSNIYGDLDPIAIGQEAGKRALELLGGEPLGTQRATVVLDPFAGAELLSFISQALTGEAMQRGLSFLLGKLGQKVASEVVNLVDNGRLPRGYASAPFDGEGVPTSLTQVMDSGVLHHLLYDHYTAQKDGTRSTGNAARGSYRHLPRVSPTNFYLEPSSLSREELIRGVDAGLYVKSTLNTGGINPVSGDYSVAANGLWIEKGKVTKPVSGVTVASTLGEILKNIAVVADDLRFVPFYGSIGAPTIRIEGMQIGGK
jgi:PmbA protein